MKRVLLLLLLTFLVAVAGTRLSERWRSEAADRRIALILEWPELRDLAARTSSEDAKLLNLLVDHRVTAVLGSAVTLGDLSAHGRLHGASGSDALATSSLTLENPLLAQSLARQLAWHGVTDVQAAGAVLQRAGQTFSALRDVELGLDPGWMRQVHHAGIHVVSRLNRDPWMSRDAAKSELAADLGLSMGDAVLFNTDDVPGGEALLPFYVRWFQRRGFRLPLFEFHPARAASRLALLVPSVAYRAHTIPTAELKDLTPDQEAARWHRAVEERSCRFLLVHAGPNDSLASLLARLDNLADDLAARRWQLGWPRERLLWIPADAAARAASWCAFPLALVVPWISLLLAWPLAEKAQTSWGRLGAFLVMSLLTMLGASVMAALADNAASRLEIVPFHGVKAAFILSWIGAVFILYRWTELTAFWQSPMRRADVLLGLSLAAIVGYALLRSGNAPAAWKHPGEQALRDQLEAWLVVRPRFKEFAVGHPLALLGFLGLAGGAAKRKSTRALVWLGLIGQVSMVNSFCHLHSPLRLAYGRSLSGLVLGSLIGGLLYLGMKPFQYRRRER